MPNLTRLTKGKSRKGECGPVTVLHVARSEPLLDDALYLLALQRFVSEEIVDDRG